MNIIKTKDVCLILGVKQQEVYGFIKNDKLPFVKVGRCYRFVEESILQWKAEYDKQQEEMRNALNEWQIASHLKCSIATVKKLVEKEGLPVLPNKWGQLLFIEEIFWCWFLSKEQNKPTIEGNHERTHKAAGKAGKVA